MYIISLEYLPRIVPLMGTVQAYFLRYVSIKINDEKWLCLGQLSGDKNLVLEYLLGPVILLWNSS